ncbi:hypothetical protein NHG25_05895 [Aerococcaceae bacterium NML191292]|nr:hypothetical protein [Aerococcaceae bacterium NML191292]
MTTNEQLTRIVSKMNEQQKNVLLHFAYKLYKSHIEEVEPDEWDKQAIEDYENNPNPEFTTIEAIAQEFGITL